MNLPFDRLPFPQLVKHWANDDAQKWPIEETAKMLAEAILAGEISVDPSAEEVDVVANLSGNGVVQIFLKDHRSHFVLPDAVSKPFKEIPEPEIQAALRSNFSQFTDGSTLEELPSLRLFLIQRDSFRAWLERRRLPLPQFWFSSLEVDRRGQGARRAHDKKKTQERDMGFFLRSKELTEEDSSRTQVEIARLISLDKKRNPNGLTADTIRRILVRERDNERN
jgi:hypothetical protein